MKPDINSGDRISCSKQTRSNSIKSLMGKKRLNRRFQMQQYPENSGVTCGTNLFNTTAGIINWRKDELETMDRKTRKTRSPAKQGLADRTAKTAVSVAI